MEMTGGPNVLNSQERVRLQALEAEVQRREAQHFRSASAMREIRDSSKVIGAERIAIMAGLNLAHDLLTQGGGGLVEEARTRLTHCNALLDSVLEDQDTLF